MNKTFDKVTALGNKFFNFCCLGSASGSYGYSRTATANINLIDPFFDDVMQPIYDDNFHVKMFVFIRRLCQKSNSFKSAIDTFSGENAIRMKLEQLIQHVFLRFSLFIETTQKKR